MARDARYSHCKGNEGLVSRLPTSPHPLPAPRTQTKAAGGPGCSPPQRAPPSGGSADSNQGEWPRCWGLSRLPPSMQFCDPEAGPVARCGVSSPWPSKTVPTLVWKETIHKTRYFPQWNKEASDSSLHLQGEKGFRVHVLGLGHMMEGYFVHYLLQLEAVAQRKSLKKIFLEMWMNLLDLGMYPDCQSRLWQPHPDKTSPWGCNENKQIEGYHPVASMEMLTTVVTQLWSFLLSSKGMSQGRFKTGLSQMWAGVWGCLMCSEEPQAEEEQSLHPRGSGLWKWLNLFGGWTWKCAAQMQSLSSWHSCASKLPFDWAGHTHSCSQAVLCETPPGPSAVKRTVYCTKRNKMPAHLYSFMVCLRETKGSFSIHPLCTISWGPSGKIQEVLYDAVNSLSDHQPSIEHDQPPPLFWKNRENDLCHLSHGNAICNMLWQRGQIQMTWSIYHNHFSNKNSLGWANY